MLLLSIYYYYILLKYDSYNSLFLSTDKIFFAFTVMFCCSSYISYNILTKCFTLMRSIILRHISIKYFYHTACSDVKNATYTQTKLLILLFDSVFSMVIKKKNMRHVYSTEVNSLGDELFTVTSCRIHLKLMEYIGSLA